jgi:hypothetical protein
LNDSITQTLLDETLSQHSNKSITDPRDSPPNKSPTKRSISNERKIQRKNLDTYSSTKSLNEEPLSLFDSQPSTSSNEVNRHRSAEIIRVKPQTMRDSGLFGDSLTSIINGQGTGKKVLKKSAIWSCFGKNFSKNVQNDSAAFLCEKSITRIEKP